MDLTNNEALPEDTPKGEALRDIRDLGVEFKYTFYTGIWVFLQTHFIKDVLIEIELEGQDGYDTQIIGKVEFAILNVDRANHLKRDLYEGDLQGHHFLDPFVSKVLNPSNEDFSKEIKNHFGTSLQKRNFVIIKKITLSPQYRGHLIGLKVIKDILQNYSDTCALFVMKPHGLQFKRIDEDDVELALDQFKETEKEAFEKLSNYYKVIGFEKVNGIEDLLFLNPLIPNANLEALDLYKFPAFGNRDSGLLEWSESF